MRLSYYLPVEFEKYARGKIKPFQIRRFHNKGWGFWYRKYFNGNLICVISDSELIGLMVEFLMVEKFCEIHTNDDKTKYKIIDCSNYKYIGNNESLFDALIQALKGVCDE